MTTIPAGVAQGWMLEGVGVPARLRAATFATANPTAAIQRARAFFDADGVERGRALALLGPTGVGKSLAAAALVNADLAACDAAGRDVFAWGGEPAWFLCAALVRDLASFRTAGDAMRRVTRARVLVIDDVQVPDDDAARRLDEVLVVREQEARATVLTSNLRANELAAALGDRVADRIRAWADVYEIKGQSLRRAKP